MEAFRTEMMSVVGSPMKPSRIMKRPASSEPLPEAVLKKPAATDVPYKTDRCKKRKFDSMLQNGQLPPPIAEAWREVLTSAVSTVFLGWNEANKLKGRARQQACQDVVNASFHRETMETGSALVPASGKEQTFQDHACMHVCYALESQFLDGPSSVLESMKEGFGAFRQEICKQFKTKHAYQGQKGY
eukprot:5550824-Amphidinium_carterae.1